MDSRTYKLNEEVKDKSAEEVLAWAFRKFGDNIAFACSFGAEDVVLLDMIHKIRPDAYVFTIDTGRLPEETYELINRLTGKYGMKIKGYLPDNRQLEELVNRRGFYSFRNSLEERRECCRIRKVEPLKRALSGMHAWITGLRRAQSVTREQLYRVEEDVIVPGMIKINPLLEWTDDEVWKYIRKNKIHYNKLHDAGYPSIGCAPCTRAVSPGESIRAGRWWWETSEQKECGLHAGTSKAARKPVFTVEKNALPETAKHYEMDHLDKLENQSIYIIREAYKKFKDVALLWSIGKDSTTLLWLVRKAFFGRVPFPCVHCDTTYKFKEIIEYRDKYAKEWGLDLIVSKNEVALAAGMCPARGKFECCTALKTKALQNVVDKYKFKALFVGIRRDEEGSRGKERYFSPRGKDFNWNYKEQPPELWDQFKTDFDSDTHVRVHPLLHWNEIDIWEYTKREKIPVLSLYFSKNGKRYRSVGCEPCCSPRASKAANIDEVIDELKKTPESERAGRLHDKEQAYMMQKLRKQGFM